MAVPCTAFSHSGTAAHLKLNITYVIINNRSYRIIKERLLAMRGTDDFVAMDMNDPAIDFAGVAKSMGMPSQVVTDPTPACRCTQSSDGKRWVPT